MNQNVQFTYDNIPPVPGAEMDAPQQTFGQPQMRPGDGIPMFETVPVKRVNKDGTTAYEGVEYVDILTPGDPKSAPRHKVNDHIRRKYAAHYQHWRAGLEMSPSGTPLEVWPVVNRAQVMELKTQNIFTVEQLAEVADANLHRIPFGQTLKQNAKRWLEEKKSSDVVESQTREMESMRSGMAMMERTVSDLAAKLEAAEKARQEAEARSLSPDDTADEAPAKRGPGRPRKEQVNG